jgi:hypothetical protein
MIHASATLEQQINFIMSYLEGTAREWLHPHLDNEIIQNVWIPWLHHVALFWQEFDKQFGEINRVENYCSKLRTLSQMKSVQRYLCGFQSYAAPLNYNDKTLHDMFYEGLKPKIRETMVLQDFDPLDPNTAFEVLTDWALRIDQWLEAIELSWKVVVQTQPAKSVSMSSTATPGSVMNLR